MMRIHRPARPSIRAFQALCFAAVSAVSMSPLLCLDRPDIPTREQIHRLLEGKLEKYGFKREVYDKSNMTLLLGNAEMGGRARLDGLGFDRIWFSDFWRTNAARMPIFGPKFRVEGKPPGFDHYSQTLSLKDAILTTLASRGGTSWKSEIFFSAANRDLLVIRLSELRGKAKEALRLCLPVDDVSGSAGGRWDVRRSRKDKVFTLRQETPHLIIGESIDQVMKNPKRMYPNGGFPHVVNHMVYGVWCSASLQKTGETGVYAVNPKGKDEVLLLFSEATNWRSDLQDSTVLDALENTHDFKLLAGAHKDAWWNDWKRTAVLEIPDKRHERLWYRSVFWLLCTSASKVFLPGECQFAHEGWNMIPFTYGAAGWGVLAFTMLGYREKAGTMLENHFKPAAHHRNALHWLAYAQAERKASGMTEPPPYPQDPGSPEARMFAHEVRTTGDGTLTTYGNQAHLTGFALEMFHRYYRYYPTDAFLLNYLYPVAKGAAEFWSNFLIWDHLRKEYYTPKTWGCSEGGLHNSPLDAVMAAKKCLYTAAILAEKIGVDGGPAKKWRFIAGHVKIPENEKTYLAYRGHDGHIPEKSTGYNGIRYIVAANFINQDFLDELDTRKVVALLDEISKSNRFGTGFALFQSAWLASAECMYGRGDRALKYLDGFLRGYDRSRTCVRECEDRNMPYFLTNTDAYILIPILMMMQTSKGVIKPFPAVPGGWKDVAFYNLPAEKGVKVSGSMKNGKVEWVRYVTKNKKCVIKTGDEPFNTR